MYVRADEGVGQVPLTSSAAEAARGLPLQQIRDAVRRGRESLAIGLAIARGLRDEDDLTNLVFFGRHPERGERKLHRDEPEFAQLSREWLEIRDRLVRPALGLVARAARRAARPTAPTASSEIDVKPVRPEPTDSLEAGVKTITTARFRPDPNDPRDIILAATAAAEGGYDTVNMYDRGILSWGIMQWTAHAGSLQKALAHIKGRLIQMGQAPLWPQLLPNLDVRQIGGAHQFFYRGAPIPIDPPRQAPLRTLFRGASERGRCKKDVIEGWARVFARAGRHPVVQQLQRDYARKEVDNTLSKDLSRLRKLGFDGNYGRVRDYVGGDIKAATLFFGMWTNNPKQTFIHLKRAIDELASRHRTHDTERWPHGWQAALSSEFERVLRASRFGYWGDAKAARRKRPSRTARILAKLYEFIPKRGVSAA